MWFNLEAFLQVCKRSVPPLVTHGGTLATPYCRTDTSPLILTCKASWNSIIHLYKVLIWLYLNWITKMTKHFFISSHAEMQKMNFSSKCCLLLQVGLCQDFWVVFRQDSKDKNKNGDETSCKCLFYPCPVQKHRFNPIYQRKKQTHCSVHSVYLSSLVSLLSSAFAPPGSSQDCKTSWIQIFVCMFRILDWLPQLCFPVPFLCTVHAAISPPIFPHI